MKMHNKLHALGMLLILMVPMLLMVSVANAQPANDGYANATEITGLPFTDNTTTGSATVSQDDPSSNCPVSYNTVWYKGTSGSDLVFEANTFGSNYDTILTVVTGSPANFTVIACNDLSALALPLRPDREMQ